MAEKTSYSHVEIFKGKRARTDSQEEPKISQLCISSQTEGRPESIEINTDIVICRDSNNIRALEEERISILPIPTFEQYIYLLIVKSQVWNLCGTTFAVLADYELSETGMVTLKKGNILIDKSTQNCLRCCDLNCLHYKVYEQCSETESLDHCQPNIIQDRYFFTINLTTIFLIENQNFHCFYNKETKWFCDTCFSRCNQKDSLQAFLTQFNLHYKAPSPKELDYSTVSSLPIPISLDESLTRVYRQQQCNYGMNLPTELFPEKQFCEYGYQFNAEEHNTLERKGIVIYTAKEIIELIEHTVYSSICIGGCRCKASFDGGSRLLLNLNNRYFLHYDILYEYSEFMTSSSNTLHGYLRAKNKVLERLGSKSRYMYHILQHGWNAYLRMVDIDYKANFSCPTCKENPEVIILDGITLGTLKSLPEISNNIDLHQQFNLIKISDRIFIPSSGTRKKLKDYCSQGLVETTFNQVIESINNIEFTDYLLFSCSKIDGWSKIHSDFTGVHKVINLLSTQSPLPGIFQCSLLSKNEQKSLVQLSKGKFLSTNDLQLIFRKLKPVQLLFDSLPPRIDIDGLMALHHVTTPLLRLILTKMNSLFSNPTRKLVDYTCNSFDYFNYFPTISEIYKIPVYKEQGEKEDSNVKCCKIYPKHNRFSPGLLVMACQHKICYGFQILRENESTIVVYNMLISIFKKPPKIIIYDNACNLHTTCLMRDPSLFRDTAFLVDRFHSLNHKCCSSYFLKYIRSEELQKINSQVCEQIFSVLRRISTQISYMRIENVFFNTRYFLTRQNGNVLSKI